MTVPLVAFIVPPLKLPVILPSTAPLNVVAVMTPEVILFTVTSPAVPSARKIEISPPDPVILETPDILSVSYTHLTLPTKRIV